MHSLQAADAAFLYHETSNTPMHFASVQIMDLPDGVTEAPFIETLREYLLARQHLQPLMTRKLLAQPGGFSHPVWAIDPQFDMRNHVYRVNVPAPGGRREMETTVAKLHATTLARDRPLWEIAVLCGLYGRRIAYYSRTHHACVDGMAGTAAMMRLMDQTPYAVEPPVLTEGVPQPSNHSVEQVMIDAWESFVKTSIESYHGVVGEMQSRIRLGQRLRDPIAALSGAFHEAPASRFNKTIAAKRRFASAELPLAELSELGRPFNASVSEVFLSLCGGALRLYLERHGELPAQSLQAGCPVSVSATGNKSSSNGQTAMMRIGLGTHIKSPLDRLVYVVESSRVAKAITADMAALNPRDMSFPGLPAQMKRASAQSNRSAEGNWESNFKSVINVVISNIPGPEVQLYSNGARMLTNYPVSIPAHGNALTIAAQRYVDQLFIGFTACARAVPDADLLRDDLLDAYSALVKAVKSIQIDIRLDDGLDANSYNKPLTAA